MYSYIAGIVLIASMVIPIPNMRPFAAIKADLGAFSTP